MSTQLAYPPSVSPAYLPTQGRARILVILLIANAAFALLSAITALLGIIFPLPEDGGDTAEPLVLLVALLIVGIAIMQLLVYIATIVVFLMWLYRSHQNLPSFGVKRNTIQYSSAWAVGSFFVPIVSLFVPYRAVKEVWSKSLPNSSDMFGEVSPPAFFPLWWGVWLISNFANNIHFRLTMQDGISMETSHLFTIGLAVVDIASAILALTVVREIEKQQFESSKLIPAEHSQSGAPPAPPRFDQVPAAQA